MPTKSEMKVLLSAALILTIVFSSIMIYRGSVTDPAQDAIYSEVYGLEE
ncbi:MAG TPA: hypothetical protein H9948_10620 [Candidatus Jeotgalibaca merdavium]|uniref:Uncharacterized protein n=1 Tax=Candidatus Jeotgalibaca merdavium TaxID=2838627 RepID=A0A9D2KYE8_9LACT|nr:hypothetical protein [Candidatus Jeotgalibaca merdavium]